MCTLATLCTAMRHEGQARVACHVARPRCAAAPGLQGAHGIHGIFKVGVTVTVTVADIDAVHATRRSRGVTVAQPLERRGTRRRDAVRHSRQARGLLALLPRSP